MNRRSFFGFACGGLIAAPVAILVGECPSNGKLGIVGEVGPEVTAGMLPKYTVEITGAAGDTHIRTLVQQGVEVAMHRRDDQVRRGGVGAEQCRYTTMKG